MSVADWSDFFVASAGASAGLAGLIIVAMSVNIETIVSIPSMPSRAAATIAALVLVVVVSIAGLMPQLPPLAFGLVILAGGLVSLGIGLESGWRIFATRSAETPPGGRLLKTTAVVLPALVIVVGGVLETAGIAAGLYLAAAGILLAFVCSVLNAWVLLVEIRR